MPTPTNRCLLLLAVTAPLLAAVAVNPVFAWVAGTWLLLVLSLALADLRLSANRDAWEVARTCDDRLSLAAWNRVEVTARLRRGLRRTRVWLRDDAPAGFGVDPAGRVLAGPVAPGETGRFAYRVRPPRRGDYRFGDLYLRWESPYGLWRRQALFSLGRRIKVYPNLADVKKYDLLLRRDRLWELGLRSTHVFGSGNEYERLRDYLPDDEYRRISWKATARRGKPVSVEYETERSQNLMVLLDVGRMMRSPVGDVSKMDYAVNAALLLAYVATQRGDRVGFLAFADREQAWLAPRTGHAQFERMLEALYALEAQGVEPDYTAAFGYLAARQRKRSLVLVFTDLIPGPSLDALTAQMVHLRRQHLPLLVTVADAGVNALARQPVVDSKTLYERTVAEDLVEERRLAIDRMRRQGVLALDVPADELSVAVINRYLELKARTIL